MINFKQQKIAKKITPELFLKKTLSEPYEIIENCRIFHVDDRASINELTKSVDIDFCKNIDEFKDRLTRGKPNLFIDANLINKVLLREIISASSQTKNIILGNL